MSKKVILVSNGDAVYAVPTDVCEKYKLEGGDLKAAQGALEGEGDVEGQSFYTSDSSGRAWQYEGTNENGAAQYSRAPWRDE